MGRKGFKPLPKQDLPSVSGNMMDDMVMWTPPSEIIVSKNSLKRPSISPNKIVKILFLVIFFSISTVFTLMVVKPLVSEFLHPTPFTGVSEELQQIQDKLADLTLRLENKEKMLSELSNPRTSKLYFDEIDRVEKNIIMIQLKMLRVQKDLEKEWLDFKSQHSVLQPQMLKIDKEILDLKNQNTLSATSVFKLYKKFQLLQEKLNKTLIHDNNEDPLGLEKDSNQLAIPEKNEDNEFLIKEETTEGNNNFEEKHASTKKFASDEIQSSTSIPPMNTEEFGQKLRDISRHSWYRFR